MSKKTKATLYLEKDVVNRAKKSDINMSKIANNALKERFGLEKQTSGQRDLRKLLQETEEDGRLHLLPFKITEVKVENIRKFDGASLSFEEGLNIIYGPNGSGKSTIIESIVKTFTPDPGEDEKDFIKHDRNTGKTFIQLENNAVERRFVSGNRFEEGKDGLLLIDTPFSYLGDENRSKLLKELKEAFDSQVIVTTTDKNLKEHADNFIRLRTFSEERKEELEAKIAELEKELEVKKNDLRGAVTDIEDLEEELDDLQTSKYQVESSLEKMEELEESVEVLEEEIANLKEDSASIERELEETDSEREIGRLEERKDNLSNKLENKKGRLEEYKSKMDKTEDKLEKTEEIEEKIHDLSSKIEHKTNLKHELKEEIKVLREDLEELRDEKKEISEKIEVAK